MTNDEFKFWIEGYLTLTPDTYFNLKQYSIVKNHANLVKEMADDLEPSIALFLLNLECDLHQTGSISISDFHIYAKPMLAA